ncbi:TPA: hypothetical protein HA246_01935 [Candidatus Woesearchaeota archaeon]|nr:hypothetical protein [Candidatus Woesearchaeota archaeon]
MRSTRLFSIISLAFIISLLLISSCTKLNQEDLRSQCCNECREAWSTSPAAIAPSAVNCVHFTTAKKVSTECEDYFKANKVKVTECDNN